MEANKNKKKHTHTLILQAHLLPERTEYKILYCSIIVQCTDEIEQKETNDVNER